MTLAEGLFPSEVHDVLILVSARAVRGIHGFDGFSKAVVGSIV
jgi:hypothetical protein